MYRSFDHEKKSSQLTNSAQPKATYLQTRGFAPIQTDLDEDATFRPSGYTENFLEKIINQDGSQSSLSDSRVQAKSMNRLKAAKAERIAIQAKQNDASNTRSTPQKEQNRLNDDQADWMAIQAKMDASNVEMPSRSILPKPINRFKAASSERMKVQAKLSIGKPNDKYESEADEVASRVVQQINSPIQDNAVQKQESVQEEEEELQMKPISSIQREEMPDDDEELQMKPDPIQREYSSSGKINRFLSEEMDVTTEIDEARQTNPASIRHTDVLSPKINRAGAPTLLEVDPRISPMKKNQNSDLNVNRKVNRQTDTTDTIDISDFDVQTIQRQPHITAAPQSTIQRDDTDSVQPNQKKKSNFLAGALYNEKPEAPRWEKNKWKKENPGISEQEMKVKEKEYVDKNGDLHLGEGVRSFLLDTFCGPFMYISSYRRKKFTDSFNENKAIYMDKGSESIDQSEPHGVLRFLANSEKILGEVAKTIGWIGLVCGISSFIAAAIPFGQPAAAVLGAIATVAGLTTAGISLVRLILNTILAVKNLGFHTKAMNDNKIGIANNARKQTYKHFAQAISNLISLVSAGAGLGITFGAGSGINLGSTLSSSSAQSSVDAVGPKLSSVLSTTTRGLPLGGIGKTVEEGIKQIGKEKHNNPQVNQQNNPPVNQQNNPPVNQQNNPPVNQQNNPPVNQQNNPPVNQQNDPPVNQQNDPPVNQQNNPPINQQNNPPVNQQNNPPRLVRSQSAPELRNFQLKPDNDLFLQRDPEESQVNENAQELASAKIEAHKVIQDNVMGTLESGSSASNTEKSEIGQAEQNLTTGGTNLNQLVEKNTDLDQKTGEMDTKAKEGDEALNVEVDGVVSKSEKLKNETQAESEQEKLNKLDEKLTEVETQGGISNDKEKLNWKQKLKNKLKSGWKSIKKFFVKAYGNLKARLKKIFAAIQLKLAQMVVKFGGLSEPVQNLQLGVSNAKNNVKPSHESIEDSLTSNQETGTAAEQLMEVISGYKG